RKIVRGSTGDNHDRSRHGTPPACSRTHAHSHSGWIFAMNGQASGRGKARTFQRSSFSSGHSMMSQSGSSHEQGERAPHEGLQIGGDRVAGALAAQSLEGAADLGFAESLKAQGAVQL